MLKQTYQRKCAQVEGVFNLYNARSCAKGEYGYEARARIELQSACVDYASGRAQHLIPVDAWDARVLPLVFTDRVWNTCGSSRTGPSTDDSSRHAKRKKT
eukprot:scaffold994_cov226-Prasinococcus_capsulatus_cf.AAC.20